MNNCEYYSFRAHPYSPVPIRPDRPSNARPSHLFNETARSRKPVRGGLCTRKCPAGVDGAGCEVPERMHSLTSNGRPPAFRVSSPDQLNVRRAHSTTPNRQHFSRSGNWKTVTPIPRRGLTRQPRVAQLLLGYPGYHDHDSSQPCKGCTRRQPRRAWKGGTLTGFARVVGP